MNRAGWLIRRFIVVALMLVVPAGVCAQPEFDTMRSEIESLRQRIAELEREGVVPYEPFTLRALDKTITLGGLLELQAFYEKIKGGDDRSDLQLATVELWADVDINENIGASLSVLWEDDADSSIELDQAVIFLRHPQSFWSHYVTFAGGKMYLPFGDFSSVFISDPLTLELGETNRIAAVFGLQGDFLTLKVGAFNGKVDTSDKDRIDSWVASLEVAPLEGLTLGVSYLSDLAESDIELLQNGAEELYTSSVAAGGAYLSWAWSAFALQAEVISALENFSDEVIQVSEEYLTGKRPWAWSLELSWVPAQRWQLGVKAEGAEDFQDDLKRYGAVVSRGLFRNTVLGLEYLYGDSNAHESHTATAQLAFNF